MLGLQWRDMDIDRGVIQIRHILSRLMKFDISQSAYPYVRLYSYAPLKNKTAIYLGPVKTKKAARAIYLPHRAAQAFRKIQMMERERAGGEAEFNPHGLVFCTEEGHPFEAKALEEGFRQILTDLQLKSVNLHATRHTFATEALQKATDIVTVSEILGHAKPSTTLDMYGHTFDSRKRALMAQL